MNNYKVAPSGGSYNLVECRQLGTSLGIYPSSWRLSQHIILQHTPNLVSMQQVSEALPC